MRLQEIVDARGLRDGCSSPPLPPALLLVKDAVCTAGKGVYIYINAAFTSDADRADKARPTQSGELEVFQQEDRMPAMVLSRTDTPGEIVLARAICAVYPRKRTFKT